jgi:hypothetical protein
VPTVTSIMGAPLHQLRARIRRDVKSAPCREHIWAQFYFPWPSFGLYSGKWSATETGEHRWLPYVLMRPSLIHFQTVKELIRARTFARLRVALPSAQMRRPSTIWVSRAPLRENRRGL